MDTSEPAYHYQVVVVRSLQPITMSVRINPTRSHRDGECMVIKSHIDDPMATIDVAYPFHMQPLPFKTLVDKKRTIDIWNADKMATEDGNQDISLSRSSSTSSFEAIMEGPQNTEGSGNLFVVPRPVPFNRSTPTHEPMATETKTIAKSNEPLTQQSQNMLEVILRNVMDMVNMASVTNDQASLDCLKRMVYRFAEEILDHESLLDLPYESLIKTFTDTRNESSMEYALSKGIIRWVEARDDRSQYLPKLLAKIKLGNLTPEQLIDLGNHKLVRTSLDCRDIIDEYKNSLLMSQSMNLASLSITTNLSESHSLPSTKSIQSAPAIPAGKANNYLYILARGCSNSDEYSIHQIALETGISLKVQSRPTFLCVNLEDNLYVFGHPNVYGRSVEMYNFEQQIWTSKTYWPTDLIISSVCVVGQFIYFLGFRDNGPYSLHKYDPVKDQVTPIRIAYEWVAIDGDIILAYEGLVLFVKTGLAYNPTKQCWKNLLPIPEKMVNGQSLIAYKDRMINFCAPDQFYWFNPKDGSEGSLQTWSQWLAEGGASHSLCPRVDLLVLNSKLYLVEKAIFDNCTLQVIQYDDNNDRWLKLHSINLIDKPIRCAICSSDS